MPRILIVEDEAIIASRIKRLCEELLSAEKTVISIIDTTLAAEAFLATTDIDLLLLDLNVHGKDGFDLLRFAVSGSFQTIVISAHKDRAIEAFEYGILDFIPKPFTKERLALAFERLKKAGRPEQEAAKYISIKQKNTAMLIEVTHVTHIQAIGNYANIFTETGRKYLHSKSMEKLELLLPSYFKRIHKSYIANMRFAKNVNAYTGSKYELVLQNDIRVPIGRTRYREIRDWLI